MSQDTVLIDCNSIAHAANNGARLTVGDMEVQAIFNTLRSLRTIVKDHPDWRVWGLWDGKATWRFDAHPQYKSNRKATTPAEEAKKAAYKRQTPFIKACMQYLGIKQSLVLSAEADDIAGYLTGAITKNGGAVKLISGDGDWLQLVRPKVIWHDPIRDRKVGINNFLDETGYFEPRAYLEGKALMGDSSDCIPGVGGIGEKGAPEFLATFRSVGEFHRRCDAGEFTPKLKAHINLNSPEGRAKFALNMRLMNLIDTPAPIPSDVQITRPAYSEEKFRLICERLAFASILRDFDNFLTPFRSLQGETV
jgi:5'-3' exonuclease